MVRSPHLPSQLVDQHLQSIPVRVRREVDGRPETAPILGRLELDDNGGYGCFLRGGRAGLEGLGVRGLLPLGRREEGGHCETWVRGDKDGPDKRIGEVGGKMVCIVSSQTR